MMSSGVALLVLGCLVAVLGVWASFNETQIAILAPLAPLGFVLTGGGLLFVLMGTVLTRVGHSKRIRFQQHVSFVARGEA
jgi:zinc transporter ZupT